MKSTLMQAKSTNGQTYVIDTVTKKAVRIDNNEKGFKQNNNIQSLPENIEQENTLSLYNFIKPHFPDASYVRGYVNVIDYRIRYMSHGFSIKDLRNFSKEVNINKYCNDYATPEPVLEFLKDTVNRPAGKIETPQENKDAIDRGKLMKLANLGKLQLLPEKPVAPVVVEQIKIIKSKTRLHLRIEGAIINYISGAIKMKEFKEIIEKLPAHLQSKAKELGDSLKKATISHRQMMIGLNRLMAEHTATLQERKEIAKTVPQRQPVFQSIDLWEPSNLQIQVACAYQTSHTDPDNIMASEFIVSTSHTDTGLGLGTHFDVDIMWMRFDTPGPSGKKVSITCTVEEYFSNVILHYYPRAMAMLMKVAKGEIAPPNVRELSFTKFIVDAYEVYDPSVLRHPVDRDAYCKFCKYILEHEGTDHCFVWQYTNEFKVGDKVRVVSPMNLIADYGKVIEVGAGISIRYAGGTVDRLKKGESIELFNW